MMQELYPSGQRLKSRYLTHQADDPDLQTVGYSSRQKIKKNFLASTITVPETTPIPRRVKLLKDVTYLKQKPIRRVTADRPFCLSGLPGHDYQAARVARFRNVSCFIVSSEGMLPFKKRSSLRKQKGTIVRQEEEVPAEAIPDSQRRLEQLREDVDFLFHEIRTPLTAVINYADFLMTHDLPAAERNPLLDIIRREGLRIDDLLNDFSRIGNSDVGTWLTEVVLTAVVIDDLLQDAAERLANASPRHLIRVEIPTTLPMVRGDRKKLDLVLRNLLANAIKYSPEGGTIVISAIDNPEEIIISVSDQGIGIPEECIQSIFNRKFRVEQHPKSHKRRGSGLGLTLVERIIAHHGGQVRVESEPGKGSAFFFSLPKIK